MSTDTKKESLATTDHTEEIDKSLAQLYAWADNKGIPRQALLDAMNGDEATGDNDEHLPPFHTVLLWTDIFSATGIKYHVTAREGATSKTIVGLLTETAEALDTLVEQAGWMPADRLPKTAEQIEASRAAVAAKLEGNGEATDEEAPATAKAAAKPAAKAKPASRAGGGSGADEQTETRTIRVESIFKGVTESGHERFTVKGFPWTQYGVMAWGDSSHIEKLSPVVDLKAWTIGETVDFSDVDVQAVVRLKEGGKPDKVIDFIGADTLASPE
jgi:hypothetical protein